VAIGPEWVEAIRQDQPELPLEKRERFIRDYQIPAYDAGVLTQSRALADYYEEVVRLTDRPKIASNWIMGDILRFMNEEKQDITACKITPQALADLIRLIDGGTISGKIAKEVFEQMYKTGKPAAAIIAENGLVQITDEGALVQAITDVIAANPKQLEQYRGGRDKVFGFFVGQVMKATGGKANPQLLNDLLKKMLAG
jgi:aspartyl-tRNA(Asn)/glutamyl-tRNA(Gln) amidotransferase subunit B